MTPVFTFITSFYENLVATKKGRRVSVLQSSHEMTIVHEFFVKAGKVRITKILPFPFL